MATKKTSTLKSKRTKAPRRKRRPDEKILHLAERRTGLLTEAYPESDAATRKRGRAIDRLESVIVNLPAESLAGLAVKGRILAEEQIISIDDRIPPLSQAYRQGHRQFADRLAFSIWADAERLAKKGGVS